MKKIIVLLAAAALLAATLTACGNEQDTGEPTTTTDAKPSESESQGESENTEDKSDGTTQKILDAIKAAYGKNYLPNTQIPEDVLKSSYGLDPDSYTEITAEMPMISANVDTAIIVKAASGKTGDVMAALNAYHDRLASDSFQYPQNVAKVNAAQIVANRDYVAFLMLGANDDRADASDSERAKFAQEQVQIAVDAFNSYFD